MSHKVGAQVYLITALYEKYSTLNFTHYTDKAIAISGMELRLTRSYGMRSGAGVFQQHQGRWLLWTRAEDVACLLRVHYPETMPINKPPSWSFMSYIGAITYIIPPSSQVIWNKDIRLTLTGDSHTMWLYADEQLELKARILTFAEPVEINNLSKSRAEQALHEIYIIFDDPTMATEPIKTFVLVATLSLGSGLGGRAYVLAVKPFPGSPLIYERVGAGWLPERLIDDASELRRYFLIT